MTIGLTNRNDAVGNDAVDTYSYGFKIFSATDLRVTVQSPAGVETTLVYPTHYSVTGVGRAAGGTVVLASGTFSWLDADGDLGDGYTISIRRVVSLTQATDLRNQDRSFLNQNSEDQFDRCVMIDQQQQDELNRSLKLPETEAGSAAATVLPTSALRLSKVLGFDGAGNLTAYDTSPAVASSLNVMHTDIGTDAEAVSLFNILRGRVYAQSYGYSPSASAAVNAAAIMRCHNMTGTRGGRIIIPRHDSKLPMAADTIKFEQRNVTIEGDSNAMSYEDSFGGSAWEFEAGNYGIDLTSWEGGSAGGYASIENIALFGNNVLQRALWCGGTVLIRGVHVRGCTAANIDLYNLINTTRLEHFSSFGGVIGLLIGSASGGLNTSMSFDHFAIRQNTTGVRIVNARGASFSNGTIESNIDHGVEIYKPTGILINDIDFYKIHFEENQYSGGAGYTVEITGQNPAVDRPKRIQFIQCSMTATLPTNGINVIAGDRVVVIDAGEHTSGQTITFGANAINCGLFPVPDGVTLSDSGTDNWKRVPGNFYELTWSATLTGISGTDPTYAVRSTKMFGVVHHSIPAITGTSDSTAKTLTGMPEELWPGYEVLDYEGMSDNGGAVALGRVTTGVDGVITLQPSPAGGSWTASGTFAATAMDISYTQ